MWQIFLIYLDDDFRAVVISKEDLELVEGYRLYESFHKFETKQQASDFWKKHGTETVYMSYHKNR